MNPFTKLLRVVVGALFKGHGTQKLFEKGIWSTDGGFEYNLVLLAAIAAATAEDSGTGWAAAQLAAGAASSVLVTEWAKRQQAPQEQRPAEEQPAEEPAEPSWSPTAFERQPA